MKTTRRTLFSMLAWLFAAALGLKARAQPPRGHMSDCGKQMFVSSAWGPITHPKTTIHCTYMGGFRWAANFIPSLKWMPPPLPHGLAAYLRRNRERSLAVPNAERIPT